MDLLQLLQVGGPIGTGAFIIGFLLQQWRENRKETREGKSQERQDNRQDEATIVNTTRDAISLVRDEMRALSETLNGERQQRKECETANETLEEENRILRQEVYDLRLHVERNRVKDGGE